ncbi:MAG: 4Fe-4S dicluster domain-containing protein [Candidatus Hydrogenedentes bacterium]|nr:4Fe-4S dicluster domain-containing protein [Candidatus Hydrogenedentota bacterium]MBI3117213.1 4Fe-4S dicluster domain-containing protein [Candidatus Hydrogenedentota bacterium]
MNEYEKEEPASRRDFLCGAAQQAAGAAIILAFGEQLVAFSEAAAGETAATAEASAGVPYDPLKHRYLYLIDVAKCIGCGACVRACALENDVPDNHFRTWVERYMVSRTGEVTTDSPNGGKDGFEPLLTGQDITKAFFVPKLCNHCSQSPCVQLCPVGASYRSPDGLILVDEKRCIGCGYCVQACPYGSRFIHPETHTASKCTLCYHRITKGMLPACVQACPTGARRFGDTQRPGDEVTEIVASSPVRILKPEMNTEPNCYYLGLSQEVR